MVSTYQEYRKNAETLSLKEMEEMLQEITTEIGDDEEALEIWRELEAQAIRYAKIRAEWYLISQEERMSRDASRTVCHDSLIVKVNMFARYLKTQGRSAKWQEKFGDLEKDPYYRKRVGDFGCYITFINGICAR